MPESLAEALANPGPHTAESLAERLPHFPVEAVRDALEALAAQGVLERVDREDGTPEYRYVAPEKYSQIHLDVIRNPAEAKNRRPR
jgi:predicted ArsR family transcriptional regulator